MHPVILPVAGHVPGVVYSSTHCQSKVCSNTMSVPPHCGRCLPIGFVHASLLDETEPAMTTAPLGSRHAESRNGVVRLVPPHTAARYAKHERQAPARPADPGVSLTEDLTVESDRASAPIRVFWRNRWHLVVEEPVRWFQRRRWWVEEARAERGRAGLVTHEIWRLQVRLQAAPATAQARSIDISHDRSSGRWRLVRVHEDVAE